MFAMMGTPEPRRRGARRGRRRGGRGRPRRWQSRGATAGGGAPVAIEHAIEARRPEALPCGGETSRVIINRGGGGGRAYRLKVRPARDFFLFFTAAARPINAAINAAIQRIQRRMGSINGVSHRWGGRDCTDLEIQSLLPLKWGRPQRLLFWAGFVSASGRRLARKRWP